ncbi:MAG: hypothetical protein JWQ27_626 [Ferruginibacter sp.]|nr:hypothetical protein [Ferruginibacter sp.]
MKSKILLSSSLIALALSAQAQQSNKAYAITGDGNHDYIWMNIRQVDLSTGQVGKTIFQRNKTNFTLTDVAAKKSVDQTATANDNIFGPGNYPTSTFVAAAAYDNRSNKLFFVPMRMGELRWVDLDIKNETPKFYSIRSDVFQMSAINDESKHITRMVIAADGNGYAVTNDGNSLIRFTTGKKPVVTDLGTLVDAEANKGISIHNKCSSWGGDMLADAFGKLYIISASHNVFVVDINSRMATFQGTITGLPAGYTTNGAAVDAEGQVVVSSANLFEGYYKFSLDKLAAVRIEGSDTKYNASDLANGNLLLQKEADAANKFSLVPNLVANEGIKSDTRIYPNPVSGNTFKVLLDGTKDGAYTIVIADIAGRSLQTTKINLLKGQQSQQVSLKARPAPGTYLVKVLNEKNQVVLTDKLLVQ